MMMTTTRTSNRRRTTSSLCLAKYTKSIQQANKRTAEEYEYRLSRFEKYILLASQEQQQQLHQQNQEPKVTITSLDQVVEELKRGSNKINPYDLFLALLHTFKRRKA
jgi:hypothetical protein